MAESKVYFTDFRTIAFGDSLPIKLKKLIRKAGIGRGRVRRRSRRARHLV